MRKLLLAAVAIGGLLAASRLAVLTGWMGPGAVVSLLGSPIVACPSRFFFDELAKSQEKTATRDAFAALTVFKCQVLDAGQWAVVTFDDKQSPLVRILLPSLVSLWLLDDYVYDSFTVSARRADASIAETRVLIDDLQKQKNQ